MFQSRHQLYGIKSSTLYEITGRECTLIRWFLSSLSFMIHILLAQNTYFSCLPLKVALEFRIGASRFPLSEDASGLRVRFKSVREWIS